MEMKAVAGTTEWFGDDNVLDYDTVHRKLVDYYWQQLDRVDAIEFYKVFISTLEIRHGRKVADTLARLAAQLDNNCRSEKGREILNTEFKNIYMVAKTRELAKNASAKSDPDTIVSTQLWNLGFMSQRFEKQNDMTDNINSIHLNFIKAFHAIDFLSDLATNHEKLKRVIPLLLKMMKLIIVNNKLKGAEISNMIFFADLVVKVFSSNDKGSFDKIINDNGRLFNFLLDNKEVIAEDEKVFFRKIIVMLCQLMDSESNREALRVNLNLPVFTDEKADSESDEEDEAKRLINDDTRGAMNSFKHQLNKIGNPKTFTLLCERALEAMFEAHTKNKKHQDEKSQLLKDVQRLVQFSEICNIAPWNEDHVRIRQDFYFMVDHYTNSAHPRLGKVGLLLTIIGLVALLAGIIILSIALPQAAPLATLVITPVIDAVILASIGAGVAATGIGLMLFSRPAKAGRCLNTVKDAGEKIRSEMRAG